MLTTQYLEEADRLADRIVLLDHGGIVATGTAGTLKAQLGGERIEFRFRTEPELLKATAVPGEGLVTDELVLGLPSDGTAAHLHQVLDVLRDASSWCSCPT